VLAIIIMISIFLGRGGSMSDAFGGFILCQLQ